MHEERRRKVVVKRAVHSLALLGLLLLLCGRTVSTAQQPGDDARITSVKGAVMVERAGGIRTAAKVNDAVSIGDELIAGPNSQAEIRTASGARVRIFPDSRVLLGPPAGGIGEFLHLFLGSVKVWVAKISGRPNPHSMTTPTAVIAVRGTTFSVFVDDDGTLVAVDEGEVGVANIGLPGSEVILRRGERTRVRRDQPPEQAQAFRGRSERANAMPKGTAPGKSGLAPAAAGARRGAAPVSAMPSVTRGAGRMGRR